MKDTRQENTHWLWFPWITVLKIGAKLRESVLTMTEEWKKAGFVEEGFVSYVSDEKVVAFPWTMIDKITPRPSEKNCR